MPESIVRIVGVEALKTQSGNTRFVVKAEDGKEYTTFREQIARDALSAEGRRARIAFHEQQRGRFTNVYVDSVEVVEEETANADDQAVEEVAWKTAVDAAPWLLGSEPTKVVDADDLFETLQPFKERVADDIRDTDAEP